MDTGKLRHLITIESYSMTQGAYGEPIATWSTFSTAWASITPGSGKEFFASKMRNPEISHSITIRYLSGLTSKMRVNFNGRYFDILDVLNVDERGFEHHLMCVESTNSQNAM